MTKGSAATATLRGYFVAMSVASDFSTDGWYVLTGLDKGTASYDGTGQEFLMRTTSVPEPSTYLLMATGLLCINVVRRNRIMGLANEV